METIFGPDGLIAQAHPEYEHRPGQIDMARAVMRAFEERRHLIVEAGTGTGRLSLILFLRLLPRSAGAVASSSPPAPKIFRNN